MTIFRPLERGLEDTLARLEWWRTHPGELAGLSTGYTALDEATGGFEPSDLVVLGGRPGMGKTALALNVAARVARRSCAEGEAVLIVSTEMPADLIRRRLAAMASRTNEHKLRIGAGSEDEYTAFRKGLQIAAKLPILISDRAGVWTENPANPLDGDTVAGAARRLIADGVRPRLLVVDHVGRIGDNPTESPAYRVGRIARNLKNLAMETRTPVLALSQLNRQVEQRDDKRPQLSDLRDSGEVEQEADTVLLIYRQDYYLQPDMAGYDRRQAGRCRIEVAKARSGPTAEFLLSFDPATTLFS